MKNQNVAIVGLNKIGEVFLNEMLSLKAKGVNVLGVYSEESDSGQQTAREAGIRSMSIPEIIDLGEGLDIIFDFSGDRTVRAELRSTLFSSNNQHTVIAPESVAQLMWAMIGAEQLNSGSPHIGY